MAPLLARRLKSRIVSGSRGALVCAVLAAGALPAWSQTAGPAPSQAQGATKAAGASGSAGAKVPAAATAAAVPGDGGLKQRVEQLEEQLVDLQVVIGTLESLARTGNGGAAPPPAAKGGAGLSAADSARIDSLEVQLRTLSSQVEQLNAQMRGGRPAPRTDAAPTVAPPQTAAAAALPLPATAAPAQPPAGPPAPSFGPKTVTSDELDPIGGLIESTQPAAVPPPAAGPAPMAPAGGATVTPATTGGAGAKQLYETAYGQLLRQDYGAAQAGFTDFLKQYPRDTLAPDALYWLGETHFVQQNYNDAAEAFDLVTSSYASSSKAPDAQIRKATALAQAGKKDQACAAFRQFGVKFPNARPNIKAKADSERQRAGCV